ncbi:MAG: riboflavin synthase, partial [Pyrinomonadaceae bacterium]
MFTGIIEELGRLRELERRGRGAHLIVEAQVVTGDLKEGDSVAVNGVCLTAVKAGADYFSADVSVETLERSTLGSFYSGVRVNLERGVTPNSRLGGHIVQGHTDGRGGFQSVVREDES